MCVCGGSLKCIGQIWVNRRSAHLRQKGVYILPSDLRKYSVGQPTSGSDQNITLMRGCICVVFASDVSGEAMSCS